MKARSRRLEVVEPLETLRSDEEPDEVERELERAKRELAEARSAVPDLRLAFEGGDNHLHLEWRPFGAFDESTLARLAAEWRAHHPHVKAATRSVRLSDGSRFLMDGFRAFCRGLIPRKALPGQTRRSTGLAVRTRRICVDGRKR